MKHSPYTRIGIVFVLAFLMAASLSAQKNPKDTFKYPSLHKINMPKVNETTLKNGIKLFLVEDPDYPTIDLRAMILTGSIYEPADKIGLASVTGTVLRTGGSKNISGDKLDALLETLGATVETYIGEGSGGVAISVFKEDIDKGLEVLADLLMHPAFPEEKINLAKIEMKSEISRRNDDIGQIANREFAKLIYGANNPYARHPEYATIEAITRSDLLAFHNEYFHPNNITFAAWGDFKSKDLQQKIASVFAAWNPGKLDIPPKPKIDYTYDFTVNYIDKPDVNQSNIMLGHIGGTMDNPDYPALIVMNQILSFDRMFKRVRTDEGLAYNVWGAFGANYGYPGAFSSGCQTKSESTVKAIKIMLEEIDKIRQTEVTDEEITKAKDSYLNGFVFNFDSKAKIVNRLMIYDYYDYPKDFMDTVKESVEKTTKADILRVAKKYLHPDKVRILVVGKKDDFDEPLSTLGPVKTIDIAIPAPKGEEAPEATAQSLDKGKALFDKAIDASGGLEAIQKIENMKVSMQLSQVTPMGEMDLTGEILMVYPDRMKAKIATPMGEIEMVLNGQEGWMTIPGQGTMPLPENEKRNYTETFFRDPVIYFTKADQVQYIGKRKLGD
ncbi:MAG: pitrilysin family protein, partial [bacterium]